MVVEDESIVGQDIRNMLLALGYEVTSLVTTSEEAVQQADQTRPDLVLMDVMLHGETTGVKAADQIYNQLNIPVVYLTAYADPNTLQKAKITEPFGYILKPFEERELQTTIEIALYKFKMQMQLREREQRFFTILRSIGDAVMATDQQGHITFMNPLAEKLTGFEQKKALKKPLNQIFRIQSLNHKRKYQIDVQDLRQGNKLEIPDEVYLISQNQKKIPISLNIAPIQDEEKNISGVVVAFADISRRKKAEYDLKKSMQKLKNSLHETVRAIASIIETRDPYTAGHQHRATNLACAIAKEMNLSSDRIDGLRMAGNLHDIGKITVPAEILSKPGKISEEEYNIIKTHPRVGYDIIKNIEFPWPVAQIVLQHHERLDGSGYPLGIKRNQILLEAKILAVADVIEAMASHRPYRPAKSIHKALQEVSYHKGSLYAPEVVDACLRVFEKGFQFEAA
ncbi:response regulator [bacterium]|nr:response regulator [bacterium]